MTDNNVKLRVFVSANALAHLIFDITSTFPQVENYITVSQLRRASLSVVLNIVEGNGKKLTSNVEFIRFLKISYGSLVETEYLIDFCYKRKYVSEQQYINAQMLCKQCGAQLWNLIKYKE